MGVGSNYNTSSTWASFGVLSDGTPPLAVVPETNTGLGLVLLLAAAFAHRIWQQRRARLVFSTIPVARPRQNSR